MSITLSQTDQKVLEVLEAMSQEFDGITAQMNDPAVATDHVKYAKIAREQVKLRGQVEAYRKFLGMKDELEGALEMAATEEDAELKEMAQEEAKTLEAGLDGVLTEAKEKLVMSDDASINSIILEIRAGTGGDEAALFAGSLYEMYKRYAEKQKWKLEVISYSASEVGGYKEIFVGVKGSGVWSAFGYEMGGHRVQRVPETETQGRIHTSAATVAVMAEPEEIEVELKDAEILEHVSRAGGPGGQSVNTCCSAIKLEHIPTGITVSMRDEKSQHKNRAKAYRILRSRIYEHFKQIEDDKRSSTRKSMVGSGDRSQRIRTYNFPQNRMTDHRINLTIYSLDKIITGDMQEVVDALQIYDKQQRLEAL